MKPGKTVIEWICFAILALLSGELVYPAIAQQAGNDPVYLPIIMNGSSNSPQPTPSPTPPPGSLAPESIFGVNTGGMTDTEILTDVLNAGSSWVHSTQPVRWAEVEPVEGQRNWEALAGVEAELREASRLGLRVILTVEDPPAWARQENTNCGPVLPEKLPALAAFLKDLFQRYSADPYRVRYWELWNEPDVAGAGGCWGDPQDPYFGGGAYGAMLKAVYGPIQSADPEAQVLIGGLRLECDPDHPPGGKDCASSRFLEGILRGGGAGSFDGISFHAWDGFAIYDLPWGTAYQYSNYNWHSYWHATGPVLVPKVAFIRSVLAKYGLTGMPLYNTQSAILCASCQEVPIFETAKAGYIAQTYAAAKALGLKANLWESLFGWQNSGLLEPDFTPRPAYQAFHFARQVVGDGEYAGQVTPDEVGGATGLRGYKFTFEDGRQVWLLWHVSLAEPPEAISFAVPPDAVWDAAGSPLAPSGDLVVGYEPVYVEWTPYGFVSERDG